jgi:hypothetical protein
MGYPPKIGTAEVHRTHFQKESIVNTYDFRDKPFSPLDILTKPSSERRSYLQYGEEKLCKC